MYRRRSTVPSFDPHEGVPFSYEFGNVANEIDNLAADARTTHVVDATSPANAIQVGGDHYRRMAIQPWDFIAANGIGYFEGSAIAYIARWRHKGGVEDLRKAVHYLNKLIELEAT